MRTYSKIICGILILCGFYLAYAHFEDQKEVPKVDLISHIDGYLAWDREKRINPTSNLEAFIEGVRASAANANPPQNLSPQQMYDLRLEVEFESNRQACAENLQKSEAMLREIARMANIKSIISDQLVYEQIAPGRGPTIVTASGTYWFHYTVSTVSALNQEVVFDSRTIPSAQKICLDSVVPGFSQGVVGMKQGERRKLYIHPNLAFRSMHWTVAPNALLIIDVELVATAEVEKKAV